MRVAVDGCVTHVIGKELIGGSGKTVDPEQDCTGKAWSWMGSSKN